jgi:hypothetical protein
VNMAAGLRFIAPLSAADTDAPDESADAGQHHRAMAYPRIDWGLGAMASAGRF